MAFSLVSPKRFAARPALPTTEADIPSRPHVRPIPAPELADDSVVLRPWADDDWPLLVDGWNDREVAAWTSPPDDRTEAAARRWIAGQDLRRARWLALDLVIEDRRQGTLVGEIGLSSFSTERTVEIGYWMLASGRGRGLATASVRLLSDWVVTTMPSLTVIAEVDVSNTASTSVLRRSGYQTGAATQAGVSRWQRGPNVDRCDC